MRIALGGGYLLALQCVSLLHGGRHQCAVLALLTVVVVVTVAFAVHFQEAVEGHYLACCHENFLAPRDVYLHNRLLQLRVSHLRGCGAFPYQVVEPALLLRAFHLLLVHVGRSDGLVRLLRALGVSGVVA